MGKVQSTLLTITFIAWTSNATCDSTAGLQPASGEECVPDGSCCETDCTILDFGVNSCGAISTTLLGEVQALILEYLKAVKDQAKLDADNALVEAGLLDGNQTIANTIDWEAYGDEREKDANLYTDAEVAIAKGEAILEAISHSTNYNQDNHDDFKQQLALQMQANVNSAKAEADKAEASADDAQDSAKDAAISALDSKGYAADAKKDKDDSDDILSSIKKLVEGWIGHSHGGCSQPPCSQPCQYSAMNPMYYYHC